MTARLSVLAEVLATLTEEPDVAWWRQAMAHAAVRVEESGAIVGSIDGLDFRHGDVAEAMEALVAAGVVHVDALDPASRSWWDHARSWPCACSARYVSCVAPRGARVGDILAFDGDGGVVVARGGRSETVAGVLAPGGWLAQSTAPGPPCEACGGVGRMAEREALPPNLRALALWASLGTSIRVAEDIVRSLEPVAVPVWTTWPTRAAGWLSANSYPARWALDDLGLRLLAVHGDCAMIGLPLPGAAWNEDAVFVGSLRQSA